MVGWLSQNLWTFITGVGVLIYTYFMTNRRQLLEHPPYCKDSCSSQYQSNLFFLIGDLIRIRFLNILIAFSIELDVRFNILFVLFIRLDIWFSLYHFYLFGLNIKIDLSISSNLKAG